MRRSRRKGKPRWRKQDENLHVHGVVGSQRGWRIPVQCPALPGVRAYGDTRKEAIQNIRISISHKLDTLIVERQAHPEGRRTGRPGRLVTKGIWSCGSACRGGWSAGQALQIVSARQQFFRILSTASAMLSRLPKADRRKNPSRKDRNRFPGVPTTWHSVSSLSKNSHDESPPGVFSQMYGALTPPYTVNPAPFNPSRITLAFPM